MQSLLNFYSNSGPERVGLIMEDNSIIEVENLNPDPNAGFIVRAEEMVKPGVVGTWHTHPGLPKNLSSVDYIGFCNWPGLTHYIVGSDGVAKYVVRDGMVIND